MASTTSRLYETLREVSLEKYHGKFTSRGVLDVEELLCLTLQDYATFGVTSMTDREKLFRFIQSLKQHHGNKNNLMENSGKDTTRDGSVAGRRGSLKRPREAAGNISPAVEKPKGKTPALDPKPPTRTSTNTPTPKRNRLKESVITPGKSYNYGVPSSHAKISLLKKINASGSKIRVCVRKRPLTQAELMSGENDVVEVKADAVTITTPKHAVDLTKYTQKHQFLFDEAFDESCTNQEVYERTAKPLIQTVFNRGKATCFAYGCTGSGKTFTMLGNELVQGMYLLAASDMFSLLHSGVHGQGLGVWVSFYEIYCGQLFDLLNVRSRLFAREDGNQQVCIAGLTETRVTNVEQLMEVIESGGNVRSTGSTGVNADSSRSHAVLQLQLKSDEAGDKLGRFSFIDLAGSERAADVIDTNKQTRLEGAEINQSLLALKECIRALDQDSRHTPFRQSKLTQVLKDSFVGNSQTCMIANISPGLSCSENTLNTLRYADRVKELKKTSQGDTSPLARPVTVHGTSSHPPPPVVTDSAVFSSKLLPRVVIEPLPPQGPGQLHGPLKALKVSDGTSTREVHPSTTSREMETTTDNEFYLSTKRSLPSSHGARKDQKYGTRDSTFSSRPRTSPNVALVQVKPAKIDETNQLVLRAEKNTGGPPSRESREKSGKRTTEPKRDGKDSKCARMKKADSHASTTTRRQKSRASNVIGNSKSCEEISIKRRVTEDANEGTNGEITRSNKGLLQKVNIEGNKRKESGKNMGITTRKFLEGRLVLNATNLKNVQSCEDISWKRTKTEDVRVEVTTGRLSNANVSSDPKPLLRNNQNCEDVVVKEVVTNNTDSGNRAGNRSLSGNVQTLEVSPELSKRQNSGGMPSSINSRYNTSLKTRISKLFGSKNIDSTRNEPSGSCSSSRPVNTAACTEPRPARKPSQRSARRESSQRSPREAAQGGGSSLTEEQVVAAHHTQLALVTGLCREEMLLLRQMDAGSKDFVDYIAELDDILTRKMSSIQSLRGKIARYPLND